MPSIDFSLAISTGENGSSPSATVTVLRNGKSQAVGSIEITAETTRADLEAFGKKKAIEAAIGFEAQDAEEAARLALVTRANTLQTQIGSSRITVTEAEIQAERNAIAACEVAEQEAARLRAEENEAARNNADA